MRRSHMGLAAAAAFAAAATLVALPATAWPADGPVAVVTRAVQAMAPGAAAVPGGYRFTLDGVAVSVLADEAAGLLRVVARAGRLGEREVGLVAAALSADMIPDLGVRMVSVRGLMCAAVLAPLRGLTDGLLRRAVDGAVQTARAAAGAEDEARAAEPGSSGGGGLGEASGGALGAAPVGGLEDAPALLPPDGNLPVHDGPTSR